MLQQHGVYINTEHYGEYKDAALLDLLDRHRIHMLLHLSAVPETYCYALTHSIKSGLPIVFIDRGAFHERLEGHGGRFFGAADEDGVFDAIVTCITYLRTPGGRGSEPLGASSVSPGRWYLENYPRPR